MIRVKAVDQNAAKSRVSLEMHILYTREGHDGRAKGKIANHPYSKFETSGRWYDTFCESMKERKEHKYICFAKRLQPNNTREPDSRK